MIKFTREESIHYSRHFNLSEIGMEGQLLLKKARVLYIGAGGLGSSALLYLAAAGVGKIGIVDNDRVDVSNLQRQILYTYKNLHEHKSVAASRHLHDLNPHIQIVTHECRLSHDNALEIISEYDIVADGSDNFVTRYIVNDACFHLKKPLVYASVSQFEGQCSVFTTESGPCYRCLFEAPPPPGLILNCAEAGVLGVLPGIIGSIQATEVLKIILRMGHPLIRRLLTFDALEMKFKEFTVEINPHCRLCKLQQKYEDMPHHGIEENAICEVESISVDEFSKWRERDPQDYSLVDVRTHAEHALFNIGGVNIPLGELPERYVELNRNNPVIIYCQYGHRSKQALSILRNKGFLEVNHLTGGIMEWIKKPTPHYR